MRGRGAEHRTAKGESKATSEDQRQALLEPFLHDERRRSPARGRRPRCRRWSRLVESAREQGRWSSRSWRGPEHRLRTQRRTPNEACKGTGDKSSECWTGASHVWNIAWKTDGSSVMTPSTPSPSTPGHQSRVVDRPREDCRAPIVAALDHGSWSPRGSSGSLPKPPPAGRERRSARAAVAAPPQRRRPRPVARVGHASAHSPARAA